MTLSLSLSLIHTQAEQRAPAAGLGAVGSSYGTHSTSGSYRDNVMSVARARFQQMFANDKWHELYMINFM